MRICILIMIVGLFGCSPPSRTETEGIHGLVFTGGDPLHDDVEGKTFSVEGEVVGNVASGQGRRFGIVSVKISGRVNRDGDVRVILFENKVLRDANVLIDTDHSGRHFISLNFGEYEKSVYERSNGSIVVFSVEIKEIKIQ